ncbi:hypothetical protein SCFA_20012 [anaerobic digester metagenome]|uniref:Uncharacterized protein n=1 Tax=anaerobic digester metagenome TaxID=1263854 RepID=A0A485LZI4_9ZZZZ
MNRPKPPKRQVSEYSSEHAAMQEYIKKRAERFSAVPLCGHYLSNSCFFLVSQPFL